MDRIRFSYWCI